MSSVTFKLRLFVNLTLMKTFINNIKSILMLYSLKLLYLFILSIYNFYSIVIKVIILEDYKRY